MTKEPMTRAELNELGCSIPDCTDSHDVIYFHPSCHDGGAVYASFNKKTGILRLECSTCEKPIIDVLVADQDYEAHLFDAVPERSN